jgi:hypothetical protein
VLEPLKGYLTSFGPSGGFLVKRRNADPVGGFCHAEIPRRNFGSAVKEGFINHAICPLDRQILARLNECLSGALPMASPSMGHIANMRTYDFCQELIADFAGSCGGTPLLFDYWAWKRGG